jgi:tetratricopeptide (TPR) repeat protein
MPPEDIAPEDIPARDQPVGAVPPDQIPSEETPAGAISPDEAPAEGAPGDTRPATPETIGEALGSAGSELDRVETQIEAREFDAAARWLEAHLVEIERDTHRYDPALVRPLVLLGDANMGRSRYVEALQHYQRATHLARVNAGLKSLDQVPIVYREAAAYKALGEYEEANDREEYAYQILSANMGPNDLELLPALYRLAEWYLATGNAFAARGLYERAIRTYEGNGQGETAAAIPALQGLANTYRLERFPSGYAASQQSAAVAAEMDQPMTVNNFPAGEAALQKVVRIRQQTPDGDPMLLVEAVLDLADWYTLFEKPQRANPLYAHAFESMGQIADADRVAYFAQPRLLYVPDPGTPRRRTVGAAGDALRGFVEVGFSVTQNGYVRDLVTIGSEPPDLMDVRVRRSVRVARYRPALVDGVPVASTNQTYRHEFPYWTEPEEESADKSEGESAATQDQGEQE